jgi:transcription elongation factor Elf1
MKPITIQCELCGELAVVHCVQFTYNNDGRQTAAEPLLTETQRQINCPNCGDRTQVETTPLESY